MMIVAFAVYAVLIMVLPGFMGNHGLWLALVLFMLVRGITLALPYKKIREACFLR
jgi:MATE family multidrug resistance protein